MRKLLLLLLLAAVAALAVVAAGCGGGGEEEASTGPTAQTPGVDECAKENLETRTPGILTIGTDNPAYPPWFEIPKQASEPWELGDPTTGEGFESAVAYAIAEEMGYTRDEVEWVVVPFAQSFRPGVKDFDFDINQISYSDERAQAVDFSDSYYDVNQALVALDGNAVTGATSLAELKGAKLGAPVGTTSYQYIVDNIQPDDQPSVYDTLNDALTALKAKQIDGVVVDLPTAFFVTAAQIENSTIVGQFPAAGEQEYFALVFEKGNPARLCVNAAIARLKESGRLAEIQQEWLSDNASAPVLE
ncbi:MAG: ABC transporter substrate-binding protein [Gaiellaceae bacterium]